VRVTIGAGPSTRRFAARSGRTALRTLAAPAAVALALAVAAAPRAAGANPIDLFGFGARAQSMAGAATAGADDASANYYNPALLAGSRDIRIDVGYQLAQPYLSVDGHGQGVDSSRGTALGLVVPGAVAGARLAVGAALFLPDQQITRTRTLPSPQPRWALYDNRPQRIFLSANLSFALPGGVSIGGGISYMSSTQGDVGLRGIVGFPDATTSQLELDMDVDLKTVRYPQAGVAWEATPWLTLAATYRGGFHLTLDQTFDIRGDIGTPGAPPLVTDGYLHLRSVAQDLFQPAQLTAAAHARITPRLDVAFELSLHRWRVFENPAAEIEIELDIGDFNNLVNIPPQEALPAPHFHDIAIPRLGAEWLASATARRVWRLRGGYAYEPSPAPEQFGATNFIDNDKHTLSTGAGLELLGGIGGVILRPVSVDVSLVATYLPERAHHKLIAADPVGDYRSRGLVIAGALSSKWRF
jgi:long-chain fatty acid transport protein